MKEWVVPSIFRPKDVEEQKRKLEKKSNVKSNDLFSESNLNKTQKENLEVLENWFKPISGYKQLKLCEARNLYSKMQEENDELKRFFVK